jgi:alanine-glyoxylate transaminase / serine-glyoxylate transaminase / serine-pyruvate transaminase
LRVLFGAKVSDQLLIPGTGTMGLEMAAANFVPPGGSVVVASTGIWGNRWTQICRRIGHVVHEITSEAGSSIDCDNLASTLDNTRATALLVTHVDSSTGVAVDLTQITRVARRFGARVLIDGICAAGAEPVQQDSNDVDVYIASTPKAIAAPAGLILISIKGSAAQELETRAWPCPTFSLDLQPWLTVFRRIEEGRFGYFQSPAGNLVLALRESLRLILDEGLEARYGRHRQCRDALHSGLDALEIEILATRSSRSSAVTVCRYPGEYDSRILSELRSFGVEVPAGTHPELGEQTFRVGHLGNVRMSDIDRTLSALSNVCHRSLTPGKC